MEQSTQTGGNSQPKPGFPRLLLVGHTYMIAVNREKALHLAKHFQVRVCTCDSKGWMVLGREVADTNPPAHEAAYELRRLTRWPRWQNYTRLVFRGLQAEIAGFRPDLILVETEPWSWLRWQARWAAWRAAPGARFVEFTWENVERPGLKGMLLRLMYRAAAATGGLIVCGNREARRLCIEAGYPAGDSTVAPQLGINMADHLPASNEEKASWRSGLGWPASARVLGFCGRLVEEKGLVELVAAAGTLRSTHPDLRVAIMGEGALREKLEAVDPGGNWLKVLHAVRHEDVPDFLNKLDVFILPSKPMKDSSGQVWEEQFGHVLIEAMACGVLTLGSDSGAIPEVLDDASVTFPHDDSARMAAMIDYWLARDSERDLKAAGQRDRCARKWTHESVARVYADFLNPSGAGTGDGRGIQRSIQAKTP